MQAAKALRNAIDAVIKTNPNAKILCMGDFNDHPSDNSLIKGLQADGANGNLINLMKPLESKGLGSHNYKGEWGMLDQIVVSASFNKTKKGLGIKKGEAKIFKEDWMLYKGESPSKTYGGPNYYGGYSDHLPVYVIL
jgi:predicted extracellular nuclease